MKYLFFSIIMVLLLISCSSTTPIDYSPKPYVIAGKTPDLSSLVASGSNVDNEMERIIFEILRTPSANKPSYFDRQLQYLTVDVSNGVVSITHNNWFAFTSTDELGEFGYGVIFAATKAPEAYYLVNEVYTELTKIKVVFPNEIGDIIMSLSGRTIIHAVADDYTKLDSLIEITKGSPSRTENIDIEPSGCPQGCTIPPSGCDIKGNISFETGEKIFHVPGQEYYDETYISPEYGERWFCTEREAIANGWRKSLASPSPAFTPQRSTTSYEEFILQQTSDAHQFMKEQKLLGP